MRFARAVGSERSINKIVIFWQSDSVLFCGHQFIREMQRNNWCLLRNGSVLLRDCRMCSGLRRCRGQLLWSQLFRLWSRRRLRRIADERLVWIGRMCDIRALVCWHRVFGLWCGVMGHFGDTRLLVSWLPCHTCDFCVFLKTLLPVINVPHLWLFWCASMSTMSCIIHWITSLQ